jgi:predicted DNA-binding protein YlxM (UPF0122 family)
MQEMFRDEKEAELIQDALGVFLLHGLKKVTMDDVAKHLKVSKKTLYKYVKNRKELIKKTTKLQIYLDQKNIKEIEAKGLNAIEENIEITQYTVNTLNKLHPDIHSDLENYFADSWEIFKEHQANFLFSTVAKNIEKGKKEGLYDPNINTEIVTLIYISKIDMVFNGSIFPIVKFKFSEVFRTLILQHMKGMATEKGVKLLDKLNFIY